jgi:6-phosphofructokinase 1
VTTTRTEIGVLTGGGDAPGLNAALFGLCRRLATYGISVLGFRDGWRGVLEDDAFPIDLQHLRSLATRGGTMLGASSASPYRGAADGVRQVRDVFARRQLAGLVAIGGDGTLIAAERLHREEGLPLVGVPKTIDNDLAATDFTFGFMSAVERATALIDQLRSTSESHHRIMVVECMGRHAGWITAYAGMAAACDAILVPERPVELRGLYDRLRDLRRRGRGSAMLAVAEGARIYEDGRCLSTEERDEFGAYKTGGVAALVARRLEAELGWEARALVLGHLQRAGDPIAFDRIFAVRLGAKAARLVVEGKFGRMAALRNGEVVDVPLADAVAAPKKLSDHFIDAYEGFFTQ